MAGKTAHPTTLAIHVRDDGIMDGCAQYRFRIPFEELRRRVPGGVFDWGPIGEVREWAGRGRQYKLIHTSQGLARVPIPTPADYDMFLLPRWRPVPYAPGEFEAIPEINKDALKKLGIELTGHSHLIDILRILKGGITTVLEFDDDYFTQSRDLEYDYYDLFYEFIQHGDAFTVSTDYLKRIVNKYAPGKPVFVLPNCVMWSEWQDRERWDTLPEDAVILGLTGSKTHLEDWKVLETVLPRILKEHRQAFYLAGSFLPDYLQPLMDQFPDQALYVPPVLYGEYPDLIRQADIVLCPVFPEDEFNWSKSAIKAIEGLAASRQLPNGQMGGAVPITSDLYYYRRVTGGNKRGLTIEHTPEAWYDAITHLLTNESTRWQMAKKGRSWVYQNRSIEQQWSLWWNAYRTIHKLRRRKR